MWAFLLRFNAKEVRSDSLPLEIHCLVFICLLMSRKINNNDIFGQIISDHCHFGPFYSYICGYCAIRIKNSSSKIWKCGGSQIWPLKGKIEILLNFWNDFWNLVLFDLFWTCRKLKIMGYSSWNLMYDAELKIRRARHSQLYVMCTIS